ncbi:TIGR03621 family F420-dependent LLM class oxidoreductase [Klenkia terrae]|uniref:TIGR03621 family F420-dependent LLM class oxidoreductase n=1 Tax=Klenkia terrae TaxID=1052259 RepID=A0ABU8ECP9_9ACTN
MTRPFRFIAPAPRLGTDPAAWRAEVRRIEDLGFTTMSIGDHLSSGWVLEPLTAMTVAAEATTSLRVLSLALANDYRHPVLLHKALATLDVFSGGRVEVGIGAGWMAADYTAAGIPMARPGVRIDRREEALAVRTGLFGPAPLTFAGEHYRVQDLTGLPRPVQAPRPPLLVGGGGRRMLELAARTADVVGVHCTLRSGVQDSEAVADLTAERVAEKVGWVREAAAAAGRDPELQFSVYHSRVGRDAPAPSSSFAALMAAAGDTLADSPAVLVGDVDECVDRLQEVRERYGFSYLNLGADLDGLAPLVARLAGT